MLNEGIVLLIYINEDKHLKQRICLNYNKEININ